MPSAVERNVVSNPMMAFLLAVSAWKSETPERERLSPGFSLVGGTHQAHGVFQLDTGAGMARGVEAVFPEGEAHPVNDGADALGGVRRYFIVAVVSGKQHLSPVRGGDGVHVSGRIPKDRLRGLHSGTCT